MFSKYVHKHTNTPTPTCVFYTTQTGIAGEIQLSWTTYELIKEQYACKVRGKIAVKGEARVAPLPPWYQESTGGEGGRCRTVYPGARGWQSQGQGRGPAARASSVSFRTASRACFAVPAALHTSNMRTRV